MHEGVPLTGSRPGAHSHRKPRLFSCTLNVESSRAAASEG